MGFASDFDYDIEQAQKKAEAKFYRKLSKRKPTHEADSPEEAHKWAHNEYAEYGVWQVDDQ